VFKWVRPRSHERLPMGSIWTGWIQLTFSCTIFLCSILFLFQIFEMIWVHKFSRLSFCMYLWSLPAWFKRLKIVYMLKNDYYQDLGVWLYTCFRLENRFIDHLHAVTANN
jgi:hypothetical protein